MDLQQMMKVRPQDYLREGFLDEGGASRPELSGEPSLAFAYRCAAEGLSAETLQGLAELLRQAADLDEADDRDEPLGPEALDALDLAAQADDVARSAPLRELIEAARPHLNTVKDLAAFCAHLERIAGRLDLITVLSGDEQPAEARPADDDDL